MPYYSDRLSALGKLVSDATAAVERTKQQHEEAKANLNRLQREVIPDLLNEIGVADVTLPDGMRFQLTQDLDIAMPVATRPEAIEWLIDNGYGGLLRTEVVARFGADELMNATLVAEALIEDGLTAELKSSVPPQTLKAWGRERLQAGEELPECFRVNPYAFAKISKK